jgi:hypothetical protein
VFVGIASVKVTVEALAGPLLVNTWVYVMGSPALTDVTEGVLVTTRSASVVEVTTVLLTVALLLVETGSEQAALLQLATDAVSLMIVPFAAVALTCSTGEKVTDALEARLLPLLSVHGNVVGPTVPTAGGTQVQCLGTVIDWKLVLVGI